MKKLEKPLEKDRDQGKEPKIKVCFTTVCNIYLLSKILCDLFG